MKITFDATRKLAGIGLSPWSRLGPERWFEHYAIASWYGWDMAGSPDVPAVYAVTDEQPTLLLSTGLDTATLLASPFFQQLIVHKLPQYDLFTYKPVEAPVAFRKAGLRYVSGDAALAARLENKARFRRDFQDMRLPFPSYTIVERSSLQANTETLQRILGNAESVIVQDVSLSGGRGTFVVHDQETLAQALMAIERLGGGRYVVISRHITTGHERSVQAVVTRYGTFVGPLQKQLIDHPLLVHPNNSRFCGGEVGADDLCEAAYPEIRRYALAIGERLHSLGYKGIFGVDYLVDDMGRVYVLEINPRITGMTPLVTMLYREGHDIPFYLLHILELSDLEYQISDMSLDPTPPTGGLLVMHAQENELKQLRSSITSGLYSLDDVSFIRQQAYFPVKSTGSHLLAQQYTPPGALVKPGGQLSTLFIDGPIMGHQDGLLPIAEKAIKRLSKQITYEDATYERNSS